MAPTRVLTEDKHLMRSSVPNVKEQRETEKDETEQQLEKILFGDQAGFLDALTTPSYIHDGVLQHATEDGLELLDNQVDHLDTSGIPDEDLFFLDSGTGALPTQVEHLVKNDIEPSSQEPRRPIWYDSDDEQRNISLSSHTRLRKLRETADEDMISGVEYVQRLRKQYERLHPVPKWVQHARKRQRLSDHNSDGSSDVDDSMDEDNDDAHLADIQPLASLLRNVGQLTNDPRSVTIPQSSRPRELRDGMLDIQRLSDITGHGPSAIDTLQFHVHLPLLIAAGPSSTVRLYHVSPKSLNPNPLLTSLHTKGGPIHTAAFCSPQSRPETSSHVDTRIFFAGRRRYFHTWSLSSGKVSKITTTVYGTARHEQRTMEAFKVSPCGRFMGIIGSSRKGGGVVNVISTETMQWLCSCRIDSRGGLADFAWWGNGDGFAAIGKNGEVSEYHIASHRVVARWVDEGAVGVTVIAMGGFTSNHSSTSRWVATGSTSGVVNLYDRSQWQRFEDLPTGESVQKPIPVKTLDQLTTPISHLVVSDDGQMLAMASRWKKNALKLVHLPSCTIFQNWPTDKTPLGRISSVALSKDGNYLAVGNEQGKIRLWNIIA